MDRAIREKETRGEVEPGATATLLNIRENHRESSRVGGTTLARRQAIAIARGR